MLDALDRTMLELFVYFTLAASIVVAAVCAWALSAATKAAHAADAANRQAMAANANAVLAREAAEDAREKAAALRKIIEQEQGPTP